MNGDFLAHSVGGVNSMGSLGIEFSIGMAADECGKAE